MKASLRENPLQTLCQPLCEVAIILAIFSIFGAWPIPDSNEPYYVGKAIHFWQPDWIPNDTFLESRDSHWSFYVVFGWLSFFLSPPQMAWTGRLIAWGLLAWSWQRLSFSLLPVRWLSIPTAMALACYVDSFHMAGEWLLGGIEGKSLAFPFVFFGLEAMVRGRWNRVWIFLGVASAFHVLVGGWTVLVALFVCCCDQKSPGHRSGDKIRLSFAGLFLGGLIALFGLVPALMLDHGASKEIVREAHRIYVFDRLYHHLVPYMLPWTYVARFFLLTAIWVLFCRFGSSPRRRRFDLFVWGTLLLSLVGLLAAYGLRENRELSAEILRFYWFRMSDVAVPMGVALGAAGRLLHGLRILRRPHQKSEYPLFFEWTLLLGFPFAGYLLADYLLFGRWFFSWTIRPEPCIPWAIALILCGLFARFAVKTQAERWRGLGIYGSVLIYGVLLFYAPFQSLQTSGDLRTRFSYSRIEPGNAMSAYYWIDACRWIADPVNTPKTAKFLVPREGATFKWHAGRSDVGVWKDIPQDAEGIVAWQRTMQDLFSYRNEEGETSWDRSLTILLWWKTPEEIEQMRVKYGFEYVLCGRYPELSHHSDLEVVYENELYRVYRMKIARKQ